MPGAVDSLVALANKRGEGLVGRHISMANPV